jgi:hypothetical protein
MPRAILVKVDDDTMEYTFDSKSALEFATQMREILDRYPTAKGVAINVDEETNMITLRPMLDSEETDQHEIIVKRGEKK